MAAYLQSLRRLAAEPLRMLLPAHGDPLADPTATLARYLYHRLWREERIVAALSSEAQSVAELWAVAYADAAPATRPLAERSLLSHLRKLAAEGRALAEGPRWRAL